jgi:hypothetical protein
MDNLDGEDWDLKMTPFSETCMYCTQLNEDILKRTCRAFPDGIPDEIWMGRNNHHKPYPGDHGIQFSDGQRFIAEHLVFTGYEQVTDKDRALMEFANKKNRIAFEEQEKKKALQLTQKQDPSDEPEQITSGQGRIL